MDRKIGFHGRCSKNFFRLTPGREVRLKYAYIVKCESVDKDDKGNIKAIHCSYDPETRSGMPESNRKVKATIHWLSAQHAKTAEVRLFDRLFCVADPDEVTEGKSFLDNLNPNSLQIIKAYTEPEFPKTEVLLTTNSNASAIFALTKIRPTRNLFSIER